MPAEARPQFETNRQTKLTAALKDALGGNCRTVMVANLWPEAAHLEECVSTLRFASRVRARARAISFGCDSFSARGRALKSGLPRRINKAHPNPLSFPQKQNATNPPQVRSLVTEAVVNESADPGLLVKRYERQIRELKQELAMRDMLRCAQLTQMAGSCICAFGCGAALAWLCIDKNCKAHLRSIDS